MKSDGLIQLPELARGLAGLWRRAPRIARLVKTMSAARPETRQSLGRVLEATAKKYPARVAVESETGRLTWGDLDRIANQLAHTLRALGVRSGDAVAVLMDNRIEYLSLVCAVAKLGATASLLNTNLRGGGLAHSLSCAPPRLLVAGEEHWDRAAALDGEHSLAWVRDTTDGRCPVDAVDLLQLARRSPPHSPASTRTVPMGTPALYVFTSGTTGLPKASPMSHYRWIGAGLMFGEVCLGLGPRDVIYAPLPLYHNQAITLCWASCVRTGATLVIRRRFSATGFWEDCKRTRATVIAYIGEIARYLLNQAPGPMDRGHGVTKMVGVGLRPDLWSPFKTRFGIQEVYEYYSASELNAGFFNVLNLDRTVGFCPAPWALVAFDPDAGEPVRTARGRLRRLGRGEVGLLITRVTERFRFEGYTDAEATKKKLLRDVFEDGDAWVNTGDLMRHLGFGHLQFTDRVGDTFRWKSENVATTEVESAICAEPSVADAAVYGVEVPHASGRAGMAAVVPTNGTIDHHALLTRLRTELPGYAVPLFLRVLDTLEVTGTFKHKKQPLRATGYDPGGISDPLFVLLPEADAYTPLTPELFARIQAGGLTL